MSKKYLFLTILLLASAIVVAGVQGISSLAENSESDQMTLRQMYENAITVDQAVAICEKQGTTATEESYLVRGKVSSVSIETEKYGNATIVLTVINNETRAAVSLQLYRVFSFDGQWFKTTDDIKVDDEVIAYGPLVNYKGTTPEMNGGRIMAVNGKTSYSNETEEPNNPDQPTSTTIYVDCEFAPYLYTWGDTEIGTWPGIQMTEQTEVGGVNFWYMTLEASDNLNIIFNDGNGNQTADIDGVVGNRYYWYNGQTDYEDVTEQVNNGTYSQPEYNKTSLLTNPNFMNFDSGWTYENVGFENRVAYSDCSNTFNVCQTIQAPAAGLYEVQVQGYYNYLGNGGGDAYFLEERRDVPVFLYANGNTTTLKNVFDESIDESTYLEWENLGYGFEHFTYCTDVCKYYPSYQWGAWSVFNRDMYHNSVYVYIPEEGQDIRLGVKGSTYDEREGSCSQAFWSNFRLYYWGQDAEKAADALTQTILAARQLMDNELLTDRGINVIKTAIEEAATAQESQDAESKLTALVALSTTIETVKTTMMKKQADFVIPSNNYQYFYNTDTIYIDKVKIAFRNSNGNAAAYNNYGRLIVYNGAQVTIFSEEPIVDLLFNYDNQYSFFGQPDSGEMTANHWSGDTQQLTILNNTGNSQTFRNVRVTFDNPTTEELIERLDLQIAEAEAVIAALTHENVYGKDALAQMITEAKALKQAEEVDADQVKAYIKSLKAAKLALETLDKSYTQLETALQLMATTGQENQFKGEAKQAAATALDTEVQAGIAQGTYTAEDIAPLLSQIQQLTEQLRLVFLTINLADPGTLGDEVLSRVQNFTDVNGLVLSGRMDDSDLSIMKNQMTNLTEIDLSGTTLKNLPNEQFNGRNQLVSVVLPANLETIGTQTFYNCRNLTNVELPTTLKTIGDYAFYNCQQMTELNVPEGVTSIGSYAYQCEYSWNYVYDEYGNRKYDEFGNYLREYYGSKLRKVTLPNSLISLGYRAFYQNISLQEVNFGEGLTTLQDETFEGCTALKTITLPASIKQIGSEAFYNTALKEVNLPEGLNIIKGNAFSNCDSLQAITLPSSVNSVYYPFQSCDNLRSITVKAIAPPYANNNDIMGGLEQQCTLYVPELSLASYKQTDKWSAFSPNIYGLNIMPENIIISDTYRLLWPDTVSINYKPNVELTKMDRGTNYWYEDRYHYAAVTVTGNATLSAKEFSMYYDYYYKRENNSSSYSRFATLVNNGKIRTDNNILKLHLRADEWNFICLPFDVKVSDIVNPTGTQFVIRGYDVVKRANAQMDETWYDMTGDDILQAGKGYIWHCAHTTYTDENGNQYSYYDIEFDVKALQTVNKNNMFRTENIEVPLEENLSEFPQNRSWNFIGNPYPCYFDTRAMNCTTPFTVWNSSNQNYRAYSPIDDQYILAPGEAFFIQRPLDQASITFMRDGRQHTPQVRTDVDYFASSARQFDFDEERSVFNLTISNGEQTDQTRFVINEDASLNNEISRDATKFMDGAANSIQFYTIENGQRFAINERPLAQATVALGMTIVKAGTYTIHLDTDADAVVHIVDLLTGTETRLDGEAGFTFQAEPGTIENRFVVRLVSGDATGINDLAPAAINETDGAVYDLQGRRVEKATKGVYIQKGKKAVVK